MAPKSSTASLSILFFFSAPFLLFQPPSSMADPLPADRESDIGGRRHQRKEVTADGGSRTSFPSPPGGEYTVKVSANGRPCVMFQARKLALRYERRKQVDLTERAFSPRKSVDTSQSLCRHDMATLVMTFGDVDDLRGLSIRMHLSNTFYESSGQWWFSVDSVSLLYNSSQEAVFNASEVYAPSSSSYHCSHVSSLERHSALLRPGSDRARRWTLTFTDFQIQAFNVTSGGFSPASDCAAFLTPAILMGLVTSLILLLVLAYAMHLLVHLNRIENERERKAHARYLYDHEQLERCCAENADDKEAS
nr:V-type proton ATPase subunit S1-like [Nerophis lumbriciformis]